MQYNKLVPVIEDAIQRAELKDIEWATTYWQQRKTTRRFIEAAKDCTPEEAAIIEVISRNRVKGNTVLTLDNAVQKALAVAATGGPKTSTGTPDEWHYAATAYNRAIDQGQGIDGLGEDRASAATFIAGLSEFPPTPLHKLQKWFPNHEGNLRSDWEEAVEYVAVKLEVKIETIQATAYLVLDK